MPKARIKGIELYYEFHDGREATVLFANGVLADTTSWAGQLHAFKKQYSVVLFDFRGQGRSDKPDEPYSMEGHAADAAGLLEVLGIPRVHWVGVSYGGEIGMLVAIRYPEKIASLTVAASVSHVEPSLKNKIDRWIAAARTENPEIFFQETVTDIFSERFRVAHPEFLEIARRSYAALDYRAVVRLLEAFQQLNITPELHKITAPTLVLCGADDSLKPVSYSQIIHGTIAHSELVVIPDCGHALTLERPEEFNNLVLNFLGRL
ncbi:MAG: alpha/beta hydrolase [Candidatus Bipolaricaulota bacterium]|nr:alpha/beta hydrolase [Candidatus Bipolaricaulota bacterium]MDW8030661.1 alpha/beta fold hydrolase [Candidatus Bipolaricaulota bacterium]